MRFFYLTEMGETYKKRGTWKPGEVGTPGHRHDARAWAGIQTKLKLAIIDLRNLMAAAPSSATPTAPSGKSVKDLASFHKAKQAQHDRDLAIQAARKKVDALRKWLSQEGASADKDGNVEMGKLQDLTVGYDTLTAAQDKTRVRIVGGRMCTDDAGRQPLSTDGMVTHFSGPGKGIYVVSKLGHFHVASHVLGNYHHSSLLAGKKVIAAGEIEVVNGWVSWISNKSGHYMPHETHLIQALHLLQKKGISMTFKVQVHNAAGKRDFNTVGEYLTARDLAGEDDYELLKLVAYIRHLTDAVLNPHGWRWRIMPEAAGVYELSTGQLVPHKTVRQWLKSRGLNPEVSVQGGGSYKHGARW